MAKRPEDLLREAVAKYKRVTDAARGGVPRPAEQAERPPARPAAAPPSSGTEGGNR